MRVLELVQIFIDNIAPILIIAFVGFLVGRRFPIDPQTVSTLLFYVLSPAIVFFSLYDSDVSGGEIVDLYVATIGFQLVMVTLAFALMLLWQVDPIRRANVLLSAFCLNAGNFGLSLVAFAFGPDVLSRAAVVFVANVTLNYTLGVFVASNGRSSAIDALFSVLRTPSVYAVVAAFSLRGLNITLPLVLERPISSLADAAIPMMLILLGIQLSNISRISQFSLVGTGISLKLIAAPFVAIAIAGLLMLTGDARTAFIIQASMPTAIMTLVLTTEFDLDRDLALSLIMATTLLSPVTLTVLIAVLQ